MISIIAAVGKNLELGKDNKLLWNIPEDMKYFRKTTDGKTVVMGRKTFESIGKALPNRKNIVLSTQNIDLDSVIVVNDYRDILSLDEDIFIIGGSQIYSLFLPYADKLYLTEIAEGKECDSYFPVFDKSLYYRKVIRESSYNDIDYSFVIYEKIH